MQLKLYQRVCPSTTGRTTDAVALYAAVCCKRVTQLKSSECAENITHCTFRQMVLNRKKWLRFWLQASNIFGLNSGSGTSFNHRKLLGLRSRLLISGYNPIPLSS